MIMIAENPYISIQGEGVHVGKPMIFLRLQGCNVGCAWCDSMYTWKNSVANEWEWDEMKVYDEIMKIQPNQVKDVWISGGEPTQQSSSLVPVVEMLNLCKFKTHICTAGWTYREALMEKLGWICVDVKAPGSQTKSNTDAVRKIAETYPEKTEFKMVVGDGDDLACAIQLALQYPKIPLTLQPMYNSEAIVSKGGATNVGPMHAYSPEDLAKRVVDLRRLENVDVRMGLQMHKHLYPEAQRGI